MSAVYPTPVPYEHPPSYKIMFVGEAPGGEEAGQGRPFIGRSGQLLRRYIERQGCGLKPAEVCFANLSKHRPRGNKFELLLGTQELSQGLTDLEAEIHRARPNVIVALGGWPLFFLTGECGRKAGKPIPGSGIKLYRGSILPAKDDFHNTKVVASYHPSYIERDWKWNPVFFLDLQRAAQESRHPRLDYTEFDEFIDPPLDVISSLQDEYRQAEWLGTDIETFPGGRFSCVGWAWKRPSGKYAGLCVTYKRLDLWPYAKRMWESLVPKIFQYGTYDVSFMQHFYGWQVGAFYDKVGWDTYVAAANLLPDFPRGLDFLCSIHTRFPYYKTERKVWKEKGDMNILWRYNLKDCVATYEIAMEQMKLMRGLYA
jgi:DNA polymerase